MSSALVHMSISKLTEAVDSLVFVQEPGLTDLILTLIGFVGTLVESRGRIREEPLVLLVGKRYLTVVCVQCHADTGRTQGHLVSGLALLEVL